MPPSCAKVAHSTAGSSSSRTTVTSLRRSPRPHLALTSPSPGPHLALTSPSPRRISPHLATSRHISPYLAISRHTPARLTRPLLRPNPALLGRAGHLAGGRAQRQAAAPAAGRLPRLRTRQPAAARTALAPCVQHGQTCSNALASARRWHLRLRTARLAAPGSSALPGGESRPLGAPPPQLLRVFELATSRSADATTAFRCLGVVPGASPPLLGGTKPRLRLPGGKVLVNGRELDAKQAKGRKRKWRGAAAPTTESEN